MGLFKKSRPETSKLDGVKQPQQPQQQPMTAEEGRQKALKLLEMPIEYRDHHGRTCQKIIKVVPRCTHAEKPVLVRFCDCWECAIVHPGKCEPIPTIERLPADSLPCSACLEKELESMSERQRARKERKEREEREWREKTAWIYDEHDRHGRLREEQEKTDQPKTETKKYVGLLLNNAEAYEKYWNQQARKESP